MTLVHRISFQSSQKKKRLCSTKWHNLDKPDGQSWCGCGRGTSSWKCDDKYSTWKMHLVLMRFWIWFHYFYLKFWWQIQHLNRLWFLLSNLICWKWFHQAYFTSTQYFLSCMIHLNPASHCIGNAKLIFTWIHKFGLQSLQRCCRFPLLSTGKIVRAMFKYIYDKRRKAKGERKRLD